MGFNTIIRPLNPQNGIVPLLGPLGPQKEIAMVSRASLNPKGSSKIKAFLLTFIQVTNIIYDRSEINPTLIISFYEC